MLVLTVIPKELDAVILVATAAKKSKSPESRSFEQNCLSFLKKDN